MERKGRRQRELERLGGQRFPPSPKGDRRASGSPAGPQGDSLGKLDENPLEFEGRNDTCLSWVYKG